MPRSYPILTPKRITGLTVDLCRIATLPGSLHLGILRAAADMTLDQRLIKGNLQYRNRFGEKFDVILHFLWLEDIDDLWNSVSTTDAVAELFMELQWQIEHQMMGPRSWTPNRVFSVTAAGQKPSNLHRETTS